MKRGILIKKKYIGLYGAYYVYELITDNEVFSSPSISAIFLAALEHNIQIKLL